jgi:hypothetical protein
MKFIPGDRVRKVGGSYQAEGKIVAAWISEDDGQPRYVFRFNLPNGMLHIFNETQLEAVESMVSVQYTLRDD